MAPVHHGEGRDMIRDTAAVWRWEHGDTAPRAFTYRQYQHFAAPEHTHADRQWGDGKLWAGYWDTDGEGRVVFHPTQEIKTVWGVRARFVRAAEQPDLPPQDHSKRTAARLARLSTVAAMVATYPDSTARELCEVTGFGHPAMQDYLRTLREDGVVEITIPDQIGYSGKRPYTFRIRGAT